MPQSQLGPIANILFFSRWLQLPLYLGLIVAQAVYVWYFMVELTHLVEAGVRQQGRAGDDPQERHAGRRRERSRRRRKRS